VNRIPIRVDVAVTLAAPFHVGGGKGGAGACSYLLRDGAGLPYWPGSAFKGKVRHYARLLYEGAAGQCGFEHSKEEGKEDSGRVKPCECMVCALLGGAGNARGSLLFGDMRLTAASKHTELRAGNAIDRCRRTAKDDHLFQTETAAADVLVGEITGTLAEADFDRQKELLEASIRAIPHIGGGTGRGLGWVKDIAVSIIAEPKADQAPSTNGDFPFVTLPVRLTAQSPLLIGTRTSESNFRATLRHIPGAVLRAALAQALVAQDGGGDETSKVNWVTPEGGKGRFPSLRKDFGELRITQFLPCDHKHVEACRFGGCRFAPMTAKHLKYGDDRDKSFDTLFCDSQGDKRTERVKGFIHPCGTLANPIQTMVVTKSAMNRFSGTSQDEMLFSTEVIPPPAVFEGFLSGQFDPAELARLTENGIRVGGYQTAGYGRCRVEVLSPVNTADTREQLRGRIVRCGEKIPVTLRSDAIVTLTEPADLTDVGYLRAYQEALFAELTGVTLTKAVARHGQWRGFDTSKRTKEILEQQTLHVIQAGAVFLLEATGLTDELLDRLLALQANGICREDIHNRNGYGQIRVADEYHFLREEMG